MCSGLQLGTQSATACSWAGMLCYKVPCTSCCEGSVHYVPAAAHGPCACRCSTPDASKAVAASVDGSFATGSAAAGSQLPTASQQPGTPNSAAGGGALEGRTSHEAGAGSYAGPGSFAGGGGGSVAGSRAESLAPDAASERGGAASTGVGVGAESCRATLGSVMGSAPSLASMGSGGTGAPSSIATAAMRAPHVGAGTSVSALNHLGAAPELGPDPLALEGLAWNYFSIGRRAWSCMCAWRAQRCMPFAMMVATGHCKWLHCMQAFHSCLFPACTVLDAPCALATSGLQRRQPPARCSLPCGCSAQVSAH